MAATLTELLAGINAKCDILAKRCRDLEARNGELEVKLKESQKALDAAQLEIEDAGRRLNYQTIAANFDSGTRDSSRQSSKIISDLVRKIDRCISRLEAE